MSSLAKKRATNKKSAHVARARGAEKPVSADIRRAAARARIESTETDPAYDATRVTVMRGDLALAVEHIRAAFDDVLAAELSDTDAQHDVLVLSALRRLRNAQSSVECEMGGAL